MHRLGFALIGILLAGLTGGCGTPDQDFKEADLAPLGLNVYWQVPIPLADGDRVKELYLLDENLYLLTEKNWLIGVNAKNGMPTRIRHQVTNIDEPVFDPFHPAAPAELRLPDPEDPSKKITKLIEPVMINTMHRLKAIDRATGELVRDLDLPFAAASGGASDGKSFFCGSTSGLYHAINLDSGVERWKKYTADAVRSPARYHDGKVYVASRDGTLYVSMVKEYGQKQWSQDLGSAVTAPIHVDERAVFVPAIDGRIHAFELSGGQPLWQPYACDGPLTQGIQVGDNLIFQYADEAEFYAVDIYTGSLVWASPKGRRVVAVLDSDVFLLDADGNIQIVVERGGEVKASVPLRSFAAFAANTKVPAVYAAKADGHLYCLRPPTAEKLTPESLR